MEPVVDAPVNDHGREGPLFSLGVTVAVVISASPLPTAGEKLVIAIESTPPDPVNDDMFMKFIAPPIPPKNCDPCAINPVQWIEKCDCIRTGLVTRSRNEIVANHYVVKEVIRTHAE